VGEGLGKPNGRTTGAALTVTKAVIVRTTCWDLARTRQVSGLLPVRAVV